MPPVPNDRKMPKATRTATDQCSEPYTPATVRAIIASVIRIKAMPSQCRRGAYGSSLAIKGSGVQPLRWKRSDITRRTDGTATR